MLQLAVNAISALLVNLADAEDDRRPESGPFYGEVVQGALSLDAAVRAGILPDNYTSDGVGALLERVKQHDLADSLERQRNAGGAPASE